MKLIVGLGNPGEKYEGTRHNLGFMVAEEVGKRLGAVGDSWKLEKKFKAEVFELTYQKPGTSPVGEFANRFLNREIFSLKETEQIFLVKPQTFMNNSGQAVKKISDYYKISLADVIVVHDDIDLPLGKIKIRLGGSAGGHHGVESVIGSLGDDKFLRVRLGIGTLHSQRSERDRQHSDTEHFVLELFATSEKAKVKQLIKRSQQAIESIIESGLEAAQNQYN